MWVYIGISKNNGTPKSSISIGFSIIFTIHFGGFTPYFLETSIYHFHPLIHGSGPWDRRLPSTPGWHSSYYTSTSCWGRRIRRRTWARAGVCLTVWCVCVCVCLCVCVFVCVLLLENTKKCVLYFFQKSIYKSVDVSFHYSKFSYDQSILGTNVYYTYIIYIYTLKQSTTNEQTQIIP